MTVMLGHEKEESAAAPRSRIWMGPERCSCRSCARADVSLHASVLQLAYCGVVERRSKRNVPGISRQRRWSILPGSGRRSTGRQGVDETFFSTRADMFRAR